jgi:D-methionine transport system substrate-binding protein
MKNRILKLLVVLTTILTSVGLFAQHADKTIIFGFAPGPYIDEFKLGVKPQLEKKGYKIEIKEFSDYVQPNLALNNGDIDANLFQHQPYLEQFSKDKGLKLSPVVTVPTAGLGIYSKKIKSISELKKGDEVTLANDPTNLARALRLLAKYNLVTFKKDVDVTKVSEKDIEKNPIGLKISPVEAAQLPRTLDSVTISLINGNYAIAAGINLDSALIKENLDENLKNLVAVRTADLDKQYVKDIKEAFESEVFKNVIEDPKNIFKGFQKPQWYLKKWNLKS